MHERIIFQYISFDIQNGTLAFQKRFKKLSKYTQKELNCLTYNTCKKQLSKQLWPKLIEMYYLALYFYENALNELMIRDS